MASVLCDASRDKKMGGDGGKKGKRIAMKVHIRLRDGESMGLERVTLI